MGRMAGQTIFGHRRVFPQKRPSQLGVALKTFLIDGLGIHQFVCHRAMGIMAIRASHLAFTQGMVGLAHQLRFDVFVTLPTSFRLVSAGQIGRIIAVDVVATGAGKIPALMFTAVPKGLPAFGVAFQTGGTLFISRTGCIGL